MTTLLESEPNWSYSTIGNYILSHHRAHHHQLFSHWCQFVLWTAHYFYCTISSNYSSFKSWLLVQLHVCLCLRYVNACLEW